MWVPHKELKKKKHKHNIKQRHGCSLFFYFFIFSFYSFNFFLRFMSFGPSEFNGINTESALRDEGYA